MNPIFARNTLLLGPDRFNQLQQARVAVFGLGGVGGTAAEGFVRSGVGHLSLIDFDRVDPSNLNRQILFTQAEVGQLKTEDRHHPDESRRRQNHDLDRPLPKALAKSAKRPSLLTTKPALGPVFGIKGGATGGGLASVAPAEDINLHFTGDMHALTSSINLISADHR
jgi:hypothetical protein